MWKRRDAQRTKKNELQNAYWLRCVCKCNCCWPTHSTKIISFCIHNYIWENIFSFFNILLCVDLFFNSHFSGALFSLSFLLTLTLLLCDNSPILLLWALLVLFVHIFRLLIVYFWCMAAILRILFVEFELHLVCKTMYCPVNCQTMAAQCQNSAKFVWFAFPHFSLFCDTHAKNSKPNMEDTQKIANTPFFPLKHFANRQISIETKRKVYTQSKWKKQKTALPDNNNSTAAIYYSQWI